MSAWRRPASHSRIGAAQERGSSGFQNLMKAQSVYKIGTNEQPQSNEPPEPAATSGHMTNKTPGQDECAARDLNPEPAD
jgi:hypothetical protein